MADPFAGITADQERSKRVLRLPTRDAPTNHAAEIERVHAMEEQIAAGASRHSSRASTRHSRMHSVFDGSNASLGSHIRLNSRAPSTFDGPEWVDNAWDSLVRGRVVASDYAPSMAGTLSDDDNVSFRSLAVAMQNQVVSDFEDFSDDRSVSSTHSGPWDDMPRAMSPARRGVLPDATGRGNDHQPMSRLQMLAEDPFLEDLSLENVSLKHAASRSTLDDAYSPPASTTTVSARGSFARAPSPDLHHSGPPSTASFNDSEHSSSYSLTLERGVHERVGDSAKTHTAPSSMSSSSSVRAVRLEDILSRADGVNQMIDQRTPVEKAVVNSEAAAQSLEQCSHLKNSSSSESATTMYTDAPTEMLSTKGNISERGRDLSNTHSAFSTGLNELHDVVDNGNEADLENSSISGDESREDSPVPETMYPSGPSQASLADSASVMSGTTNGVSGTTNGCYMAGDDMAATEFSYITEEAKSVDARSTKSSRSSTAAKRISAVPDCFVPERRSRISVFQRMAKRLDKPKPADSSLVIRHLSAPLVAKAGNLEELDGSDDEGPSVRDLRRMWSERARTVPAS